MTVVPHAVCTFCGCTCDDIELHTEGARIVKAKNACRLGESWFTYHTAEVNYPEAQRLAVGLAESLGGVIDSHSSL
jgi:formylmethanofuran dehydrogenase subunit B